MTVEPVPHVCRPVTEYYCCWCERRGVKDPYHRAGFDAEFDSHAVFQARHTYRDRAPTPSEVLERIGKGEEQP